MAKSKYTASLLRSIPDARSMAFDGDPERQYQGRYIAIEGPDGVGKTEGLKRLGRSMRHRLTGEAMSPRFVREPMNVTRSFLASLIELDDALPSAVQAAAFSADRHIQFHQTVRVPILQGGTVISDRSLWSTMTYQVANGVDPKDVVALSKTVAWPDVVIIIDRAEPFAGVEDDLDYMKLRDEVRERYQSLSRSKVLRDKGYDFRYIERPTDTTPEELADQISDILLELKLL